MCILAEQDHSGLREKYAIRAVELLRQANAAGHFKTETEIEHLRTDADLAALRDREDFKELIDDLQQPH